MDYNTIMLVAQEALRSPCGSAPILLTALALGLLIGMLQAATQIQEMTLFIPKMTVGAAPLRRTLDAGHARGIY